jgi:hypothetical protein
MSSILAQRRREAFGLESKIRFGYLDSGKSRSIDRVEIALRGGPTSALARSRSGGVGDDRLICAANEPIAAVARLGEASPRAARELRGRSR